MVCLDRNWLQSNPPELYNVKKIKLKFEILHKLITTWICNQLTKNATGDDDV